MDNAGKHLYLGQALNSEDLKAIIAAMHVGDMTYVLSDASGKLLPTDHLNRSISRQLAPPQRDHLAVVKILRRAAEIVEQPDGWCQGVHCRIDKREDVDLDSLTRIAQALTMATKTVKRQDAKRLFDAAQRVCLEGALHQADLQLFPPQDGEREFADIAKAINIIAVYIKLHWEKFRIILDQRDLEYFKERNDIQVLVDPFTLEEYTIPAPYVFNDWRTTSAEMVAALLREVADHEERE